MQADGRRRSKGGDHGEIDILAGVEINLREDDVPGDEHQRCERRRLPKVGSVGGESLDDLWQRQDEQQQDRAEGCLFGHPP